MRQLRRFPLPLVAMTWDSRSVDVRHRRVQIMMSRCRRRPSLSESRRSSWRGGC
jgi:hypothetical protein